VQGRYVGSQSEIPARFAQLEFEERYERIPDGGEIDFVFTYAAAYRRAVFFEVGGFDEAFPAPNGEDMDLAFRLQAKGHHFVFSHAASVRHVHPTSWPWYFRQKFTRAYWRQRVYARFPGKAVSDSYTPQSMKVQIVLGLLLPLALLLGVAVHPAWMGLWILLFLASCIRIARLAWRRDRELLPFVPFGCLVRALALGSGSLAGVTQWLAALRERRAAG
jgi:GT2 family glycosyltransferase